MIVGLGLDLAEIPRIRATYERQGRMWLEKNFTPQEIALLLRTPDPAPHLAARWAAKEAAYKALQTTSWIPYTDAEILGGYGQPPTLILHGLALQRFHEIGGTRLHLSLTHTDAWAAATVLFEGIPPLPPLVPAISKEGVLERSVSSEAAVLPDGLPSLPLFFPQGLPVPSKAPVSLQATLPNLPTFAKGFSSPLGLIAAIGRHGELGFQGRLPWTIPLDLRRFRQITSGHVVIMGRRTYLSLGQPLPDRTMIVVSRQADLSLPDAIIASSLPQALALARAKDDFPLVIGGASLFLEALPLASHLFLTEVDQAPQADTFFPPIVWKEWRCLQNLPMPPIRFLTFERRPSPADAGDSDGSRQN